MEGYCRDLFKIYIIPLKAQQLNITKYVNIRPHMVWYVPTSMPMILFVFVVNHARQMTRRGNAYYYSHFSSALQNTLNK
jgi:hypothetical protein